MVRRLLVAFMRFNRFDRNKEITAFPKENTVLKFRQPNVIAPKSRANITPVNQLNELMKCIKDDDFLLSNPCFNRKHTKTLSASCLKIIMT